MSATQVLVIDLCGRSDPFVTELNALDLTSADIDHILDMWADNQPAFIGEFEYREQAVAGSPC